MTDAIEEQKEQNAPGIQLWVDDWKEKFFTDHEETSLRDLTWKKVKVIRPVPEEDREETDDEFSIFEFIIVGYSIDRISSKEGKWALRYSIITSTGLSIQLTNDMTIEVIE